MTLRKTRWKVLRYERVGPADWRFVDFSDPSSPAHIGTPYPTKQALLTDSWRFAIEFGCQPPPPIQVGTHIEALNAINAVCSFLQRGEFVQGGDGDDPRVCEEAPYGGGDIQRHNERTTAAFSRVLAKKLLASSKSNGLGGCRLCAS